VTFSDTLRAEALHWWEAQRTHPFVTGLLDGSLPREAFESWVRQDWLYLQAYAQAFALAAAHAPSFEAARGYAEVLHFTLTVECPHHLAVAERIGLSRADLEGEAWPVTQAYSDFLLHHGALGDDAMRLAALLPCEWGYFHLATALAAEPPSPDPLYADWIAHYAQGAYDEQVQWLRDALDHAATGQPEATLARLREVFVTSSRYEWEFWEMCWRGAAGPAAPSRP
jgi:thiaminase/transcriptional activator TenA